MGIDSGLVQFSWFSVGFKVFHPPPRLLPLQNEVLSLCARIAPLRAADFIGGIPAIMGPSPAPPLWTPYHTATMALDALTNIIQAPPLAYPTLAGLPSASYICDMQTMWANAVFRTVLFKP